MSGILVWLRQHWIPAASTAALLALLVVILLIFSVVRGTDDLPSESTIEHLAVRAVPRRSVTSLAFVSGGLGLAAAFFDYRTLAGHAAGGALTMLTLGPFCLGTVALLAAVLLGRARRTTLGIVRSQWELISSTMSGTVLDPELHRFVTDQRDELVISGDVREEMLYRHLLVAAGH